MRMRYYHRGLSYLGKNDFRRAIADFTKVVEAAPEFVDVVSAARRRL